MRTLFFGTPSLAVPFLEMIAKETELKGVVTTPDEPSGRGYELHPSPVKQAALKLERPVLQPSNVKDPAFLSQLQNLAPELVLVVAYGKMLPPAVLATSRHGFLNVHFSLLPAYRGAAPIQRALINGEKVTGVTLFWLDEGMDTGPIFMQKSLAIQEVDNAESLREKLVRLGLEVLEDVLTAISRNQVDRRPQSGASSLAPSLKKEEGAIDWTRPAHSISNLIRGTYPWPGAFTFVSSGGKTHRLKVLKAGVLTSFSTVPSTLPAGTVVNLESSRGFVVKCGQDFLEILQVQPEGKKPMSAWDYWQGARLKIGEKLS